MDENNRELRMLIRSMMLSVPYRGKENRKLLVGGEAEDKIDNDGS